MGTTLPYLKGGYALAGAESSDTQGPHKIDRTLHGWALGGGIEQKVTESISFRAEYIHVWYGEETYFAGEDYQASATPGEDMVTAGINFRF